MFSLCSSEVMALDLLTLGDKTGNYARIMKGQTENTRMSEPISVCSIFAGKFYSFSA